MLQGDCLRTLYNSSKKESCPANMVSKQFFIEGVKQWTLPNGLRLILREDNTIPIVSSMIWYGVGSRFEESGTRGISHFLEHMMFKGTGCYEKGEIDFITTCQGGSNNAFTSYDYTAYYFSFASDRWWPALDIEAERMKNNRFDPEEFRLEKQVVIEELKMDLDRPWNALRQAVEAESYAEHPYRFPVVGVYEDLVSMRVSQMVEYYRDFYVPNNATLVVVGDVHSEEVLERVDRLFGRFPKQPIPARPEIVEPMRMNRVYVNLQKPTQIPRILISFPAPSVREQEHYVLHILEKILCEGKLSRLYRRLVEEERMVSSVTINFAETYDPSLFLVAAELCQGGDPAEVESLIFEEIDNLSRKPISDSELHRAKNQCLMQFVSSLETPLDQAEQLGLMETLDSYTYWYNFEQKIRDITAEEVVDFTGKIWTPEKSTVGVLSPNH